MVDTTNDITILREIKLAEHRVSLRSDGIVEVVFSDDMMITLKSAKQTVESIEELGGGKKCLVLKIAGKYTSAEKEARLFVASGGGSKFTIAEGIVINSLAQKILGNFYMKFEKPKVPTALFNNKEAAIKWLKKQKNK